jgi:cobalt-zinc-cadmium efflux system membrane fusion protein
MYYLFLTLSLAASLALSTIASEVGQEYVANYFAENEVKDIGIKEPGPAEPLAPSDEVKAATLVGAVTPILFASINAGNLATAAVEPANDISVNGPMIPASLVINAAAEPVRLAAASKPAEPPSPGEAAAKDAAADPTKDAVADTTKDVGAESKSAVGAQAQLVLDLARDTPHRRPDGTAFLPIATQRVFSMRWQVSRLGDVPMAYEIPGHVITSPATGTRVTAKRPGVIEASEGTYPYLGMRVRSGDLLAYLQPTMNIAEQTQIEARIQQLINLISLTEKQIERLKEVLFVRYRANKIEAMKVQLDGNRRELATLQASLERREALRANADGVISHIDAVVGGTVSQGQAIFEIVDPHALWVEAAAYDSAIAANIHGATALTQDGQTLDLEFVGGGLVLSNQAIPLRFRVIDAPERLSVGKPVTVIVRQDQTIAGIPVPASAVIRDGDGRSVVWERLSAETFSPRQVRAIRVAGNIMVVQSGLIDGARVVVEGASILNQVR